MDSGFGMRMMVPRGGGLVAEFVLDFIFLDGAFGEG